MTMYKKTMYEEENMEQESDIDDIFMQQICYYSAYMPRMQKVYLARILQKG